MTLDEAYERCRFITRSEARNFYYGFVLLPRERRAGIHAAYAFSRRADDAVDESGPLVDKLAATATLRHELDAVYRGHPDPDDPVLVAMADTVARFAIPRMHFDALLDGVEMDLTKRRYETDAELELYCDRVAGAVGLISLSIFGSANPAAVERAADLGVGLQLVNIIRDVAEDAARDRIYLPLEAMTRHGVAEDDILEGRMTSGLRDLLGEYATKARSRFASVEEMVPLLDGRARACVAMMGGTYEAILDEIEARGFDVFQGRVSLSVPRKLALMGRTTFDTLSTR